MYNYTSFRVLLGDNRIWLKDGSRYYFVSIYVCQFAIGVTLYKLGIQKNFYNTASHICN